MLYMLFTLMLFAPAGDIGSTKIAVESLERQPSIDNTTRQAVIVANAITMQCSRQIDKDTLISELENIMRRAEYTDKETAQIHQELLIKTIDFELYDAINVYWLALQTLGTLDQINTYADIDQKLKDLSGIYHSIAISWVIFVNFIQQNFTNKRHSVILEMYDLIISVYDKLADVAIAIEKGVKHESNKWKYDQIYIKEIKQCLVSGNNCVLCLPRLQLPDRPNVIAISDDLTRNELRRIIIDMFSGRPDVIDFTKDDVRRIIAGTIILR